MDPLTARGLAVLSAALLLRIFFIVALFMPQMAFADLRSDLQSTFSPQIKAAIEGEFTTLRNKLPPQFTIMFSDGERIEGRELVLAHLLNLRQNNSGLANYEFSELSIETAIQTDPGLYMIRGQVLLKRNPIGGGSVIIPISYIAMTKDDKIHGLYIDAPMTRKIQTQSIWSFLQTSANDLRSLLAGILVGTILTLAYLSVFTAPRKRTP